MIVNRVNIFLGKVITGIVHINNYSSIGSNEKILLDIRIGKNLILETGALIIKIIADGLASFRC